MNECHLIIPAKPHQLAKMSTHRAVPNCVRKIVNSMCEATPSPLFSDAAKADVHTHAEGIPRAINSLCYRSLIAAAVKGKKIIDSADLFLDNLTDA